MTPRRATSTVLIAGILSAMALSGHAVGPLLAGEAKAGLQAAPALLAGIEVQDVEETQSTAPDGSMVRAGHLGVTLPCTPGTQPFAEQLAPGGTRAWLLSANAAKDCDGDGQGDGDGDPMFADWPFFSDAYIMAGTTSASHFDANGESLFAGSILIAWTVDDVLQAAWGAFVIRVSPTGARIGEAYFGALPAGDPADVEDCVALCHALSDSVQVQYAAKALDAAQGFAVVGGYVRQANDQGVGDKDVFLALVSDDLATTFWVSSPAMAGDDQVNGVAFDSQLEIYAAGYYGTNRDGFVARFDGTTGWANALFRIRGPLDDEAHSVWIDNQGASPQVKVDGYFTDQAYFGPDLVVASGMTYFSACLTPGLDELLSLETSDDDTPQVSQVVQLGKAGQVDGVELRAGGHPSSVLTAVKRTRLGGEPIGGGSDEAHETFPDDVQIVIGQLGNCDDESADAEDDCVTKVAASDDRYIQAYGVPQAENDELTLRFGYSLPVEKPKLTTISVEIRSDFCITVNLSLGGGDAPAGVFYDLEETVQLCALDEPVITFEVPPDIAELLGFWSELPASGLLCELKLLLYGVPCDICSGGGKSAGVDASAAGSEDPDPGI